LFSANLNSSSPLSTDHRILCRIPTNSFSWQQAENPASWRRTKNDQSPIVLHRAPFLGFQTAPHL
jgi:hypothetical protein